MRPLVPDKPLHFSQYHGSNVLIQNGTQAKGRYMEAHGQFITSKPISSGQTFDLEMHGTGVVKLDSFGTKSEATNWINSKRPMPKGCLRISIKGRAHYQVQVPHPGKCVLLVCMKKQKKNTYPLKTGPGTTLAFDIEYGDVVVSIFDQTERVAFDSLCHSKHINLYSSPRTSSAFLAHFNPSSLCVLASPSIRPGLMLKLTVTSDSRTFSDCGYVRVCVAGTHSTYGNDDLFNCYGTHTCPDYKGKRLPIQSCSTEHYLVQVTNTGIIIGRGAKMGMCALTVPSVFAVAPQIPSDLYFLLEPRIISGRKQEVDKFQVPVSSGGAIWFEIHKATISVCQTFDESLYDIQGGNHRPIQSLDSSQRQPHNVQSLHRQHQSLGTVQRHGRNTSGPISSAGRQETVQPRHQSRQHRLQGFHNHAFEDFNSSDESQSTVKGNFATGFVDVDMGSLPRSDLLSDTHSLSAGDGYGGGDLINFSSPEASEINGEGHYETPATVWNRPGERPQLNRSKSMGPERSRPPARMRAMSRPGLQGAFEDRSAGFPYERHQNSGSTRIRSRSHDRSDDFNSFRRCEQWVEDVNTSLNIEVPEMALRRPEAAMAPPIPPPDYIVSTDGNESHSNVRIRDETRDLKQNLINRHSSSSSVWFSNVDGAFANTNYTHEMNIDFNAIENRFDVQNGHDSMDTINDESPSMARLSASLSEPFDVGRVVSGNPKRERKLSDQKLSWIHEEINPSLDEHETHAKVVDSGGFHAVCAGIIDASVLESDSIDAKKSPKETFDKLWKDFERLDVGGKMTKREVANGNTKNPFHVTSYQDKEMDPPKEGKTTLEGSCDQVQLQFTSELTTKLDEGCAEQLPFIDETESVGSQKLASPYPNDKLTDEKQTLRKNPWPPDEYDDETALAKCVGPCEDNAEDDADETCTKCPWPVSDDPKVNGFTSYGRDDSKHEDDVILREHSTRKIERNIVESTISNDRGTSPVTSGCTARVETGPVLKIDVDAADEEVVNNKLKRTDTLLRNLDTSPRPSLRKSWNSKKMKFLNSTPETWSCSWANGDDDS